MKKDISVNNKIIGILGAFFFISPNLNILESVLSYCKIESHDTVRLISIGIFCALDLVIAIMFFMSKPRKELITSLVVFNAVYILPVVINRNTTEIMQYMMFVLPVTIIRLSNSLQKQSNAARVAFMIICRNRPQNRRCCSS